MPDATQHELLKRVGKVLLSLAPSSHNRQHVLFVPSPTSGAASSHAGPTSRLDERSEFKLTREKRTDEECEARAAEMKRPGHPFSVPEPDRLHYVLYKVDSSSKAEWVKVL